MKTNMKNNTRTFRYVSRYSCNICGTTTDNMNGKCPKCGAPKNLLTVTDLTFNASSYR